MINERSLAEVEASYFSSDFLKPLYATYSFSQIPNTILSLFGIGSGGLPQDCIQAGQYDRIILLLLDGFGWRFFKEYHTKYPFLKRFFDEGIVSKLTSQFPSTTAAHITTLCSNQPVGEHGIYEWFIYEPLVDRVVAPLLYTFAGDKQLGALEAQLKPSEFLPQPFFFQQLKKQGISTYIFQHESIVDSIYSRFMYQGAKRTSYRSWNEAVSLLKKDLRSPGLFYLYFGDFDAAAHRHGLDSAQVKEALNQCFDQLENHLMSCPEVDSQATATLVIADHGMTDIHPSTTYYLNEQVPLLEKWLKRGADGRVLAPAGSCRDFFLHIEPQFLEKAQQELQHHLKDKALICPTSELVQNGILGLHVSSECHKRLGNLAILAKNNESIWWYEKGRFQQNFYAMHGGLTPEELETIFLFYRGKK